MAFIVKCLISMILGMLSIPVVIACIIVKALWKIGDSASEDFISWLSSDITGSD